MKAARTIHPGQDSGRSGWPAEQCVPGPIAVESCPESQRNILKNMYLIYRKQHLCFWNLLKQKQNSLGFLNH